ncbi:MAG: hypothetical protein US86_C0009G0008 [Candidatus Daviesbacteria bacterium GW2011_GWA2_38_24]|uniref:Uncharacterized protein n=1 Tax=Candidatus Daviesbacteria bacterium GW2011_GWA2_38_24 TaxID=1618422 RepID=A0A0G0JRB5_9BACT|nr:MAG: hypothetical protein US86_C0009G0008 [Candidatus Daviesbacteria bacterium GW2011_GWA2_38_24]KKQ80693.1 MAG: hypothetical protein UT01_C0007G0016 [Candidatus Daviesbacteria bacterium GW2011_GWA1_38_7]OGE24321.1 MAG: hypothetical protein A2688_00055 [Candidatus Daviesbacteria bacterium RIFCSPHIGHO2_01_FULL_38_8]
MESESINEEPIPTPDFNDEKRFNDWLDKYITTPNSSFLDPKLELTPEERLRRTKKSIQIGTNGLLQLNKPKETIINFIMSNLPPS